MKDGREHDCRFGSTRTITEVNPPEDSAEQSKYGDKVSNLVESRFSGQILIAKR